MTKEQLDLLAQRVNDTCATLEALEAEHKKADLAFKEAMGAYLDAHSQYYAEEVA